MNTSNALPDPSTCIRRSSGRLALIPHWPFGFFPPDGLVRSWCSHASGAVVDTMEELSAFLQTRQASTPRDRVPIGGIKVWAIETGAPAPFLGIRPTPVSMGSRPTETVKQQSRYYCVRSAV
jgi:hypothetical protein